jgi:AbrB family looped-hinge helix DNA binding protein
MNSRLIMDKAGRVVIPKALRDELHLEEGDALDIEVSGERITLRPHRGSGPLAKEQGVWVLRTGQPLLASTTDDVLQRIREGRDLGQLGIGGVKGFLDTSVLVPVFYADHAHHQASLALFVRLSASTGCCGAHSLAEVYATLTRMPGKHRISGEQAMLFIGSIRERLMIVPLDGDDYAQALKSAAALGIVGGNIYDALLAHCAIKAKAESIYSWNTRHFAHCGPQVVKRLRTP